MAFANGSSSREEDGHDSDAGTPRSGIQTPQPDPADKRLPGIMHSYFGQVGSGSHTSPNSGPLETPALGSDPEHTIPHHVREKNVGDEVSPVDSEPSKVEVASVGKEKEVLHSNDESSWLPSSFAPFRGRSKSLHPFPPTPPVSKPQSLHKLKLGDSSSEDEEVNAHNAAAPKDLPSSSESTSPRSRSAQHQSISESIPSKLRRASMIPQPSVVTASVHASHFSNPSTRFPDSTKTSSPITPTHSRLNPEFHDSPSYDRLKALTDQKSIPATPTRALSNQTSKSDASTGSDHAKEQNGKIPAPEPVPNTSAPTKETPAPAPAAKGKLTVKIAEARGLRKSRDPYVVAVFQRNELVSKGPLPEDGDGDEDATSSQMGGIPISRSGSDSGRPMAIPMKSRQSSNTSLSDYRDFKMKGRKSMTNPKWDTEAVL